MRKPECALYLKGAFLVVKAFIVFEKGAIHLQVRCYGNNFQTEKYRNNRNDTNLLFSSYSLFCNGHMPVFSSMAHAHETIVNSDSHLSIR